jgi:uroporphyrinogen-III synthase
MENKLRILSTGPLPHKNGDDNLTLDIIPFTEIDAVKTDEMIEKMRSLCGKSLHVVFTSMNAVKAVRFLIGSMQPTWFIYCLDGAMDNELKNSFDRSIVKAAGANATELAEVIVKDSAGQDRHIVFFCGNIAREELPDILTKANIAVEQIVAYETKPTPFKVNNNYHGILFFSPSAVKSFFSFNVVPSYTILFAIGETTATEIKNYSHNKVVTGATSSKEHLLETAVNYLKDNIVVNG